MRQIWKNALLVVVDFFSIMMGVVATYLIRFRWFTEYFENEKLISKETYLQYSAILAILIVIVFGFLGLYKVNRRENVWKTIFQLTIGLFFVTLTLIAFLFFNEYNSETIKVNRFILAIGGPICLYFLFLGRFFVILIESFLYKLDYWKINVITIGSIYTSLRDYFDNRINIKKIYNFDTLNEISYQKIKKLIENKEITEVYLKQTGNKYESKIAHLTEKHKARFTFSPKKFDEYSSFSLKPITIDKKIHLELIHSNLDGWGVIIKRIMDIVFSFIALVIFSPIILTIAIAIKMEDKGPILYMSERIGPDGRIFKLFKFRRMKLEFCTSESNPKSKKALEFEKQLIKQNDMRKDGVLYKIKDDPRTTKVGKFIEKYSLDELPQFINVFIGNMSMVGPRPHQPREVAKYQDHHYKVLNIKPGITGLAQTNGRSDLKFDEEVALDTYYLENWDIFWDIWIIIKTPFIIFFKTHKQ